MMYRFSEKISVYTKKRKKRKRRKRKRRKHVSSNSSFSYRHHYKLPLKKWRRIKRKRKQKSALRLFTSRMFFKPKNMRPLLFPVKVSATNKEGNDSSTTTVSIHNNRESRSKSRVSRTVEKTYANNKKDTMLLFSNRCKSSDSTNEMSPINVSTETSEATNSTSDSLPNFETKQRCYISNSGTLCMSEDMYPIFVEWYNFLRQNKSNLKQDFQFFGKVKPVPDDDSATQDISSTTATNKTDYESDVTVHSCDAQRYPSFVTYDLAKTHHSRNGRKITSADGKRPKLRRSTSGTSTTLLLDKDEEGLKTPNGSKRHDDDYKAFKKLVINFGKKPSENVVKTISRGNSAFNPHSVKDAVVGTNEVSNLNVTTKKISGHSQAKPDTDNKHTEMNHRKYSDSKSKPKTKVRSKSTEEKYETMHKQKHKEHSDTSKSSNRSKDLIKSTPSSRTYVIKTVLSCKSTSDNIESLKTDEDPITVNVQRSSIYSSKSNTVPKHDTPKQLTPNLRGSKSYIDRFKQAETLKQKEEEKKSKQIQNNKDKVRKLSSATVCINRQHISSSAKEDLNKNVKEKEERKLKKIQNNKGKVQNGSSTTICLSRLPSLSTKEESYRKVKQSTSHIDTKNKRFPKKDDKKNTEHIGKNALSNRISSSVSLEKNMINYEEKVKKREKSKKDDKDKSEREGRREKRNLDKTKSRERVKQPTFNIGDLRKSSQIIEEEPPGYDQMKFMEHNKNIINKNRVNKEEVTPKKIEKSNQGREHKKKKNPGEETKNKHNLKNKMEEAKKVKTVESTSSNTEKGDKIVRRNFGLYKKNYENDDSAFSERDREKGMLRKDKKKDVVQKVDSNSKNRKKERVDGNRRKIEPTAVMNYQKSTKGQQNKISNNETDSTMATTAGNYSDIFGESNSQASEEVAKLFSLITKVSNVGNITSEFIFEQIEKDWSHWEKLLLLDKLTHRIDKEESLLQKELLKYCSDISQDMMQNEKHVTETHGGVIPIFYNTNIGNITDSDQNMGDSRFSSKQSDFTVSMTPSSQTDEEKAKTRSTLENKMKTGSSVAADRVESRAMTIYSFIKKFLIRMKMNAPVEEKKEEKHLSSWKTSVSTFSTIRDGSSAGMSATTVSTGFFPKLSSDESNTAKIEANEKIDKKVKLASAFKEVKSKLGMIPKIIKSKGADRFRKVKNNIGFGKNLMGQKRVYRTHSATYFKPEKKLSLTEMIEMLKARNAMDYTPGVSFLQSTPFQTTVQVYAATAFPGAHKLGVIDPKEKYPNTQVYADRLFLAYKRHMALRNGLRKTEPKENVLPLIPMLDWKRQLVPPGIPVMLTDPAIRVKQDSSVLRMHLPDFETCLAELGWMNDDTVEELHMDPPKFEKILECLSRRRYNVGIAPEELKLVAEMTEENFADMIGEEEQEEERPLDDFLRYSISSIPSKMGLELTRFKERRRSLPPVMSALSLASLPSAMSMTSVASSKSLASLLKQIGKDDFVVDMSIPDLPESEPRQTALLSDEVRPTAEGKQSALTFREPGDVVEPSHRGPLLGTALPTRIPSILKKPSDAALVQESALRSPEEEIEVCPPQDLQGDQDIPSPQEIHGTEGVPDELSGAKTLPIVGKPLSKQEAQDVPSQQEIYTTESVPDELGGAKALPIVGKPLSKQEAQEIRETEGVPDKLRSGAKTLPIAGKPLSKVEEEEFDVCCPDEKSDKPDASEPSSQPEVILVDLDEAEEVDCDCGDFKVTLKAPNKNENLEHFKISYHKNRLQLTAPSALRRAFRCLGGSKSTQTSTPGFKKEKKRKRLRKSNVAEPQRKTPQEVETESEDATSASKGIVSEEEPQTPTPHSPISPICKKLSRLKREKKDKLEAPKKSKEERERNKRKKAEEKEKRKVEKAKRRSQSRLPKCKTQENEPDANNDDECDDQCDNKRKADEKARKSEEKRKQKEERKHRNMPTFFRSKCRKGEIPPKSSGTAVKPAKMPWIFKPNKFKRKVDVGTMKEKPPKKSSSAERTPHGKLGSLKNIRRKSKNFDDNETLKEDCCKGISDPGHELDDVKKNATSTVQIVKVPPHMKFFRPSRFRFLTTKTSHTKRKKYKKSRKKSSTTTNSTPNASSSTSEEWRSKNPRSMFYQQQYQVQVLHNQQNYYKKLRGSKPSIKFSRRRRADASVEASHFERTAVRRISNTRKNGGVSIKELEKMVAEVLPKILHKTKENIPARTEEQRRQWPNDLSEQDLSFTRIPQSRESSSVISEDVVHPDHDVAINFTKDILSSIVEEVALAIDPILSSESSYQPSEESYTFEDFTTSSGGTIGTSADVPIARDVANETVVNKKTAQIITVEAYNASLADKACSTTKEKATLVERVDIERMYNEQQHIITSVKLSDIKELLETQIKEVSSTRTPFTTPITVTPVVTTHAIQRMYEMYEPKEIIVTSVTIDNFEDSKPNITDSVIPEEIKLSKEFFKIGDFGPTSLRLSKDLAQIPPISKPQTQHIYSLGKLSSRSETATLESCRDTTKDIQIGETSITNPPSLIVLRDKAIEANDEKSNELEISKVEIQNSGVLLSEITKSEVPKLEISRLQIPKKEIPKPEMPKSAEPEINQKCPTPQPSTKTDFSKLKDLHLVDSLELFDMSSTHDRKSSQKKTEVRKTSPPKIMDQTKSKGEAKKQPTYYEIHKEVKKKQSIELKQELVMVEDSNHGNKTDCRNAGYNTPVIQRSSEFLELLYKHKLLVKVLEDLKQSEIKQIYPKESQEEIKTFKTSKSDFSLAQTRKYNVDVHKINKDKSKERIFSKERRTENKEVKNKKEDKANKSKDSSMSEERVKKSETLISSSMSQSRTTLFSDSGSEGEKKIQKTSKTISKLTETNDVSEYVDKSAFDNISCSTSTTLTQSTTREKQEIKEKSPYGDVHQVNVVTTSHVKYGQIQEFPTRQLHSLNTSMKTLEASSHSSVGDKPGLGKQNDQLQYYVNDELYKVISVQTSDSNSLSLKVDEDIDWDVYKEDVFDNSNEISSKPLLVEKPKTKKKETELTMQQIKEQRRKLEKKLLKPKPNLTIEEQQRRARKIHELLNKLPKLGDNKASAKEIETTLDSTLKLEERKKKEKEKKTRVIQSVVEELQEKSEGTESKSKKRAREETKTDGSKESAHKKKKATKREPTDEGRSKLSKHHVGEKLKKDKSLNVETPTKRRKDDTSQKENVSQTKHARSVKSKSKEQFSSSEYIVNYITPRSTPRMTDICGSPSTDAKLISSRKSMNTCKFMKMAKSQGTAPSTSHFDALDLEHVEVFCNKPRLHFDSIPERSTETDSINSTHSAYTFQLKKNKSDSFHPERPASKSDSREIGEILKLFSKLLKLMSGNK